MESMTELIPDVTEKTEFSQITEPVYQVYVRTDDRARVIEVNSSAFLTETEGWILIDEGSEWPRYMHAQGNYFPKPIYTGDGIPVYKLENGAAAERTEEELAADRAALPVPGPTDGERITALEQDKANKTDVEELNEALELILSGDTGEGDVADET